MRALLQDLKYALRQMRHAPAFAISVIVVLALGIGANAAMFTVLEGTLFRPLPYAKPERLVRLDVVSSKGEPTFANLADLVVWRQRAHTLSEIAYYSTEAAYVHTPDAEQKIVSVAASENLFHMLGATPAIGRSFTAEEQQPGKSHVTLLSDAVWRSQFHGDPEVLGQAVHIDNAVFTIIGVMPRGFAFPADGSPAQVWEPVPLDAAAFSRNFDGPSYKTIARLRDGAGIAEVNAELGDIQRQLLPLYTGQFASVMAPAGVNVTGYRYGLNAKDQRTALLALLGATGVLWLIACANVACLMLARTAARRREMAVRSALGASRWRLIRQTLAEALLLSLIAGAAGLGLAMAALRFFEHSLTTQLDPNLNLSPDGRVLLALLALSLVSTMLFALVPARLASSVVVEQALRQDGAQAGTGRHQHRLQRVLVVSELALTLALLVCCGLLLRTVFALRKAPLGFRTDHVYVIDPQLPRYKYEALDANATVYKPLLERLKLIPGVQSAAIVTVAPLEKKSHAVELTLGLSRYSKSETASTLIKATLRAGGPELQQVLGFGMARGRYFNAQDTPDTQLVAVVNSAFAKLYEPDNGDIGGFRLGMSGDDGKKPRMFKIVGVVDDLHQVGIGDPAMPEIDVDAAQMLPGDGFYEQALKRHAEVILRSSRDAKSLVPDMNQVMRHFNGDLAGSKISTMDQIVEDAMGSQVLAAHLLEALGGLALLVALAGLYSLLAYLVTLRTRELGLRLALGAQREDILSLVMRGAGVLLLAGTAIGIGVSLAAARLLHGFLFGVKQNDVATLVCSSLLLLVVGTFAAWLPARRASRLEPMEALRTE
jgi:predicted permease